MKAEDKEAQLNALMIEHYRTLRIHEASGIALRQINQKIAELEQTPADPAPNGSDPSKVETAVPA